MSTPQSYGERWLGPYSINQDGVTGTFNARDYTMFAVQIKIEGATYPGGTPTLGKLYLQSSLNDGYDGVTPDYDDFDWELEIPAGATSRQWHVGVFCGRYARIRVEANDLSAGSLRLWFYGKV